MGKGKVKKATAPAPDGGKKATALDKVVESAADKQSVADKEAKFLAALQRFVGADVELTEEKVRETIASMTPEQREELMSEGQSLKEELLTNSGEHEEELQLFRKEINARAEQADLPVEKDGDHLTKKVRGRLRTYRTRRAGATPATVLRTRHARALQEATSPGCRVGAIWLPL